VVWLLCFFPPSCGPGGKKQVTKYLSWIEKLVEHNQIAWPEKPWQNFDSHYKLIWRLLHWIKCALPETRHHFLQQMNTANVNPPKRVTWLKCNRTAFLRSTYWRTHLVNTLLCKPCLVQYINCQKKAPNYQLYLKSLCFSLFSTCNIYCQNPHILFRLMQ